MDDHIARMPIECVSRVHMFLQQNPDEFIADWDQQRSTIIMVFSKGRRL